MTSPDTMENDLLISAEVIDASVVPATIPGHWCKIRSLAGVTLLALLGVVALHSQGSPIAKVQQTHSSLRSAIQKDDADLWALPTQTRISSSLANLWQPTLLYGLRFFVL